MARRWAAGMAAAIVLATGMGCEEEREDSASEEYRRLLGEASPKIRRQGDQTFVFADGDPENPRAPDTEWFDFSGSPIPAEELQYGIGKDRIPSIDEPVFVSPDDPRLLDIPVSPYRKDEVPTTTDEIMVIGYVEAGVAKAFPIALLDRHEVVNDEFLGKPLSVGW